MIDAKTRKPVLTGACEKRHQFVRIFVYTSSKAGVLKMASLQELKSGEIVFSSDNLMFSAP